MARADYKTELVVNICAISSSYASCNHHRRPPTKPVFVDWYLVLGVDEDTASDTIRRRYRELVLQLHPDKNQHPKAEIAFKLVSEAYAVLSDKAKRKSFNHEKWDRACRECHRRSCGPGKTKMWQAFDRVKQMKSSWTRVSESLKEAGERFEEEAKVIQNCLRARGSSAKEHPVFNPSDPVMFPGYPHCRARVLNRPRDALFFNNDTCRNYFQAGRGNWESPAHGFIEQPFRTKVAHVRY